MRTRLVTGVFAVLSCVSATWAAIPARPGMLNYVEGQASIDGQQVTSKSVGSTDLEGGQVIETTRGNAEILLTPGVFMRLGDDSAVKMVNPGLADTSVELVRGRAMVEASFVQKANNIQILNQGSTTTLDKNGLYAFQSASPQVEVYDGKVTVHQGDRHEDLKKGQALTLVTMKESKFDTKRSDELYRWSDLRSSYLSEASVQSARTLVVNNYGWGGGWYWNQGFGYYSYLPGDGFISSPFGWGFYSPLYLRSYGGAYGGFYGGGHYGNGYRGAIGRPAVSSFNGIRGNSGRGFSGASAPRSSFSGGAGGGFRGGRR